METPREGLEVVDGDYKEEEQGAPDGFGGGC